MRKREPKLKSLPLQREFTVDEFKQFVNDTKKRKPNKHPESDMQKACVKWFRHQYPQYRKLFFHPANGEKRDFLTAQILNGMGVEPGVSDFVFLLPRKGFHFFCIELKVEGNDLTGAQGQFRQMVLAAGGKYEIVRSVGRFMLEMNEYLN